MWQEPKTDWLPTDYFNFEDYNRIKNNIAYLREQALKLYIDFPFTEMGDDKAGYADFPYAEEFNALEDNLESLKDNTYLWLGWHVWDYRNMPFNLLGQICLPFTAIWFFLSAVAVVLDDWIRHILWKEKMPHYKLF